MSNYVLILNECGSCRMARGGLGGYVSEFTNFDIDMGRGCNLKIIEKISQALTQHVHCEESVDA